MWRDFSSRRLALSCSLRTSAHPLNNNKTIKKMQQEEEEEEEEEEEKEEEEEEKICDLLIVSMATRSDLILLNVKISRAEFNSIESATVITSGP